MEQELTGRAQGEGQDEATLAALREAEQRFRTVADFTYDWEYWETPDGTFRYVSPSCERITGYPAERFHQDPQLLSDLILPEDRDAWGRHRHAASKEDLREVQFRIRRRDGGIRWIEHVCQPVIEEQGAFLGYRASNRDITERKWVEQELRRTQDHLEELVAARTAELAQANAQLRDEIAERERVEEAQRSSQQFLQSTLNSLSASIAILDEAGQILAVNASWRHFADENGLAWTDYGLGRNYLAVLDAVEDAPANGACKAANGIREVLAGERGQFSMEYDCHSPDERRWFTLRVTRFETGEGIRVVTAHENITERKQAEEERSRLAAIVESSDDAIIGKALDGTILSWNAGAERIYGYGAEEVMGQPISLMLPPDRPDEVARILEILQRGERVASFETERVRKDGRHIHVSLNISPIKDEAGRIIGASTIARDITARKRAEQALQKAKDAAEAAQHEEQERRQEAERRRRIAEGLGDVLTVLNSNRSLDDVLDYIAVQAGQLLGTRAAGIYSLERESGALAVRATHGLLVTYVAGVKFPIGQEALRQAMACGQPVAVPDLAASQDAGGGLASDAPPPAAQRAWAKVYRALIAVPIIVQGEVYGGMQLYYAESRTFSEEEIELAAAFGDQVALAIGNAQLRDQVKQMATIAERDRLARELHDAVTQTLFSASLIAEAMPRVWEHNPEEGRRGLEELRKLTRGAAAEMRTMLLELRPAALTEKPLGELLRHLTEAMTSRSRVPINLAVTGPTMLPADIQIALYRIAQEALNNVAKHAGASQVYVELHCQPEQVALCVRDDGGGFDPGDVLPDRFGVSIMQERAQGIGAGLAIDSRLGQGTEIKVDWHNTRGTALDG